MVTAALLRATGWTLAAVVSLSLTGAAWLGQDVEVPLFGLLVLTFIPTVDLIEVARTQLDRLKRPTGGGSGGG